MSGEVWRTYRIDRPEPRGERGLDCPKYGLPRIHHHIRFEVLSYDSDKGVWALRAVQEPGFNPDASANTRSTVIHYTREEFGKFRVYA